MSEGLRANSVFATFSVKTDSGCTNGRSCGALYAACMTTNFDPADPRLPVRFRRKFTVASSGCWEWSAGKTEGGYGRYQAGTRDDGSKDRTVSHRFSYEALVGPVPDGLQLDHLCRNRACCNPAHLEPVTPAENTRRGDAMLAIKTRGDANGMAKLTSADVASMRSMFDAGTHTQAELARLFGVTRQLVFQIVRGKVWTHLSHGGSPPSSTE